MTRGKHGTSAAARHAIEERESEIEMYRKNVARLTADNKALKLRIDEQDRNHRREMRRLRAERDQGLSPEISVMRGEISRAKEAAARDRQVCAEMGKVLRSTVLGLLSHAAHEHNLRGLDALQFVKERFPDALITIPDGAAAYLIEQQNTHPVGPLVSKRGVSKV